MERHYAAPPQEAPSLTYQVEASCRIYQAEEWLRLWETEGCNYRYQALESLDLAIEALRRSDDDRDFLKRVVAQGPYRVPVVDLGLDYAALVSLRRPDEKAPLDPHKNIEWSRDRMEDNRDLLRRVVALVNDTFPS